MTDVSHILWDNMGKKIIVKYKSFIFVSNEENNYINGWMTLKEKNLKVMFCRNFFQFHILFQFLILD